MFAVVSEILDAFFILPPKSIAMTVVAIAALVVAVNLATRIYERFEHNDKK